MYETMYFAPTSRSAQASFRLGVLGLFLLVLSVVMLDPPRMFTEGFPDPSQAERNGTLLGALVCHGLAVLAAFFAFLLGISALVAIHWSASKIKGTGLAVSGLVTATLTVLPLVVVCCLVIYASIGAAKRESANNLKALGLAIHLYYEDHRRLPPAVLRDPRLGDRGQPYSWRVAILPYFGNEGRELFFQYRRDEPWDSPANKAVLDRMPRVFAAPGDARAAEGLTHYQVVVGPGTAFERLDSRLTLADFSRGAAQTILIVEAADPVPWTKPEDLPYTPDGPLPKVGGLVGNGFHAVFVNGDVRWIEAAQRESLRTLVLRNDR
jgi:hypothetical protein